MSYLETKFRTIDGVELHGRVYAASKPGPGIVMCPGVSRTTILLLLSLLSLHIVRTPKLGESKHVSVLEKDEN